MEIKFKINDEDRDEISIDKIKLSEKNLRYTILKSLDDDLISKLKDSKKNQQEVLKDLLNTEGNLSDLHNLLVSILNIGFETNTESIFLIKNKDKYIVAEGNRRTMCLKFILGLFDFEQIIKKIKITNDYKEDLFNEEDNKEKNNEKDRKENIRKIILTINKIREKWKNATFIYNAKIVTENKELWGIIYTKHIAGERPGMREWNRGKYFADLLSILKNGINKNNHNLIKKVRTLIKREPERVIEDFKKAQFIKEIFKNNLIFSNFEIDSVIDNEIYSIMKNEKISALQQNFSLKRIKDSAKENLNINDSKFKEKYLDFSYDENNLIVFKISNKKIEILKFIYEQYKKGVITTRPIKIENKEKFDLGVKRLLFNFQIDINKPQDDQSLKKLDSFDLEIKELNKIISIAKKNKNDETVIKKFQITKIIKEDDIKLKKSEIWKDFDEEKEPLNVFSKLNEQYLHNQKKYFLNAMASTLRSILEQTIVWGSYFNDKALNIIYWKYSKENEDKKDSFLEQMAKGKFFEIFRTIMFEQKINLNDLKNIINSITNKNDNTKECEFIYNKKEEVNKILNEFIHSSHRIYIDKFIVESLEKFSKWQKNIISILNGINTNKIIDLNKKLISKINNF